VVGGTWYFFKKLCVIVIVVGSVEEGLWGWSFSEFSNILGVGFFFVNSFFVSVKLCHCLRRTSWSKSRGLRCLSVGLRPCGGAEYSFGCLVFGEFLVGDGRIAWR
jgi:hypothetical protein